ncbi:MAG: DUF1080 domain-containing protein [Bacteroidota bacterium]
MPIRLVALLPLALAMSACGPASSSNAHEAASEAPVMDWRQHDVDRPQPPRVDPAAQALPTPPPADAVVLIGPDGTGLENWEAQGPDGGDAPWVSEAGALVVVPGSGGIQTREAFGDMQLHLEWAAAVEPEKTSQDRSNSGVFFLDGRYEVQILDTYDNETYPDGAAGSIYGQFPPLAHALRPPGAWNAYDIFFRAARFSEAGELEDEARLTVLVNGVLVQNNEVLPGMTTWLESFPNEAHPRTGTIQLQDHGSPVRFRNLWVRETPDRPLPPDGYRDVAAASVPDADLDRLVGTYARDEGGQFVIERTASGLGMSMPWRPGVLRMIPTSATTFQLANTAGVLDVTLDEAGAPTRLEFTMGGRTYGATPE